MRETLRKHAKTESEMSGDSTAAALAPAQHCAVSLSPSWLKSKINAEEAHELKDQAMEGPRQNPKVAEHQSALREKQT